MLLRQVAPELAAQLHADAASKPYTVTVLPPLGRTRRPDDVVELRVAFSRADLFPPVKSALLHPVSPVRSAAAEPLPRSLTLADMFGTPGVHRLVRLRHRLPSWPRTSARPMI